MNMRGRMFSRWTGAAVVLAAVLGLTTSCSKLPTGPDVTLNYVDLTVGTGATVGPGSLVDVNYTLWLATALGSTPTKGAEIDAENGYQFVVGLNQVISGLDLGVQGMQVGGVREITVPPALGYGATGNGTTIPPDSTLIFDVTLISTTAGG